VTGVAVVGTDHPHVVELTQQLVAAGGSLRAVVATDEGIGPWLASQYPDARGDDPYADDIDVVVTAAIPSERATIALDAMHAGKDVVADKPGVTTRQQLDDVRRVQEDRNRRWLVVFAERLGVPSMRRAEALVGDGRIGHVVHTVGLGPHRLNLEHRPPWFFDSGRYGGILVDIGTHQVDQFLAFTGTPSADVVSASVRAHADHPGVEVIGEMLLRAPDSRTGYARVDYFTPKGLGAWGDVRLSVVGTSGTMEVRPLENTVTVVDEERIERVEAASEPITWAAEFLAGGMPVSQAHVYAVHDAVLQAAAIAQGAQGTSTTRPTA
jgi:predicted dehydrogenase